MSTWYCSAGQYGVDVQSACCMDNAKQLPLSRLTTCDLLTLIGPLLTYFLLGINVKTYDVLVLFTRTRTLHLVFAFPYDACERFEMPPNLVNTLTLADPDLVLIFASKGQRSRSHGWKDVGV